MKRFLILLLLIGYASYAQVEYAGANAISNAPLFYIDAADYLSKVPNKTRLDVFIEVPYASIQFIKKGDVFQAGYSVTLTFYDKEKKGILFERIWKETIKESEFTRTLSRTNYNISYRSFDLNPGSYLVRCILEDSDSRRASSKEFPVRVDVIKDTLGFSDIMLITEIIKEESGERILPNISKIVTNKNSSLPFYFDIYSNKDRQIYIEFSLENLKSRKAIKQLSPQTIKAGTNTVYYTMENLDFKLGDYSLSALIKDGEWKEIGRVEKIFNSKIYGLPNTILDLNKAIEQMIYIASVEEMSYLKESELYEDKLNRFIAFWENKKPNKNLEENPILYEYYRRIDYATKNFKGLGEGWKTDMGMIYVTFGPPNHVDRHPFDSNSVPYEIWEYYDLNRSFIFADQTGFGDYRLVNPDYSRWPGYRP